MSMKRTWCGLLSAAVATAGVMALATGCDMLKKGDDTETVAEETEPEPEPAAVDEETTEAETAAADTTAEAAVDEDADAGDDEGEIGDDEVKTYPNQIPASGTYVLLKSFSVYQAADIESKKLGGVGRGTIVTLKATLGEWLLVKWPSGPGEMKPGWIKVRTSQTNYIKPSTEPPDAGTPVVDAGKPEPKPVPSEQKRRPNPFFGRKKPNLKK